MTASQTASTFTFRRGSAISIRRSCQRASPASNNAAIINYLEEAENLCRHLAIIDDGRIIQHHPMADFLRTLRQEIILLNTHDPVFEAPDLDGFGVKTQENILKNFYL